MKTLICFCLLLPILVIAAAPPGEISRSNGSGYTYTAVQYPSTGSEINYQVREYDPSGVLVWEAWYRPLNAMVGLKPGLKFDDYGQVILTLTTPADLETMAVAYDRWGEKLWERRYDGAVFDQSVRHPPPAQPSRFPYQPGWPYTGLQTPYTIGQSLNCADVDPASPQKEVILCHMFDVYGFTYDGFMMPGWPVSQVNNTRGPSIIQQNGRGKVCFATIPENTGSLIHVRLQTGASDTGWPITIGPSVFHSPIRADLNGDSVLDVACGTEELGSANHYAAIAWNSLGQRMPNFPVRLTYPVTGMAVGDVNNDGQPEVVCSYTGNPKWLCVISASGRILAQWVITPGGGVIKGYPSLADLDGDGDLEIILPLFNSLWVGHHDGTTYWTYTFHSFDLSTSVAIADLEGDGSLEIILCCGSEGVFVFNSNGTLHEGWPVDFPLTGWGGEGVEEAGAAVGDIDGDGEQEIVVNAYSSYSMPEYRWAVMAFNPDGSLVDGFPCWEPELYVPCGTPVIADMDLDGNVEIISYAEKHSGAFTYRIAAYDLPYPYDPAHTDWPMFCHDHQRTGCFNTPLPGREPSEKISLSYELSPSPAGQTLAASPNPFNLNTTISFSLPQASQVKLSIYDLQSRLVTTLVEGWREAGAQEATFDGSDLASGVYLYRLMAGDFIASGKMVLLK